MDCVLGIDGGGTKTVCIVMNAEKEILGRGETGASNYQSIGINAAFKSIELAIENAVIEALKTIKSLEVQVICLGLAGVNRPRDIEVIKKIVNDLQKSHRLPIMWELEQIIQPDNKSNNIIICHDALIALVGGICRDVGIVVAAGTGAIAYGRNHQGISKRVGGWGYILGDEGSAYQIAIAGMKAAIQAYDGRGELTSLVDVFTNHLQLETIEDLIEFVYRRGMGVKDIAAFATLVDSAAVDGDGVANEIIDDALGELVKATFTVIDAIFCPHIPNPSPQTIRNDDFEIVTTGSVWKGKSNIRERFIKVINQKYPYIKVILPRFEPAYGAGLLALKQYLQKSDSKAAH
ncbi:N-acetylglucosamine kinase [Brunnivagina elsteri]|uniref:ATPase n=1 Tax=Brunnivagina elsteri CCALA 953 TaxID=987040 RepID=A0A2A2TIW5_9CYAN|nr:BadF/BadG/BcrA/BcrD ATPase family protein [Calothrix elsteri]PAX53871.1 ATPase [Calothrix elsteri CCALA 953]